LKRILKPIISLFMVVAIATSFTLSAAALSASDAVSFGKWLSSIPYTPGTALGTAVDWFKGKFTSTGDTTAYSNYVSSVQSALGTSTVGDNCIYLGNWSLDTDLTNSYFVSNGTFTSGSTFSWTCTYSTSSNWTSTFAVDATFVAPVSGTYVLTPFTDFSYSGTGNSTFSPNYLYVKTSSGTTVASYPNFTGQTLSASLTAGVSYTVQLTYASTGSSPRTWNIQGACRMEYPTGGLQVAAGTTNISTETRTGSLCGDYFYEGDNGTMIQAEKIYLFDETNNTINNPQTGITATASSWTYDYATRTYTIKATDGSTYKITYGNEKATEEKTDSAGTTNTYNYYYGSTSGSGGTDDPGTSWWENILKKLSDGILAIFDLVGTIIGSIIGGLADLVTSTVSSLKSLVESMGQLPGAIGSLYTWMPAELQAVISAAFTVVVFAGLIKFFM